MILPIVKKYPQRNEKCPCGSKKKFKKCHLKYDWINEIFFWQYIKGRKVLEECLKGNLIYRKG